GPVISGAWLLVDRAHEERLLLALREVPMVAAITLRSSVIGSFEEQVAENLGVFRIFSLGLAAIIVFGVVFTNARMGLTEQARDLATMRVLGYRPDEVGTILVGGLLLVTVLAIPLGIALGLWIASQVAKEFSSEMYTIPFAVSTATIGLASLATLAAAVATALLVARRVNRLDLVRTLKSRE
ncbi:MAG: FtsX-like permease family protein, partial [Thermaurantiacus sp.]